MAQDDWDPFYKQLFDYCAAKPNAAEHHPWGDTVFKIRGKVFAFLGNGQRGRVTVKAAPDDLDGLLAFPFITPSSHNLGQYGWVSVTVENDDALDLAQRLIDQSYDLIAAKTKSVPRKGRKGKGGG